MALRSMCMINGLSKKALGNLERWQLRVRNIRKKMRGWTKNVDSLSRKRKLEVLGKLDKIDQNVEIMGMSSHDYNEQKELRAQLNRLLEQEELRCLQRYKSNEIKDGDNNSRYYHAKVNGRRREK